MRNISTLIRFILPAAVLFSLFPAGAQDIHFSQFQQSPLTLNPGLAGTTIWMRGVLQYRNQWSAVTVPYSTLGASFDVKSKKRWIKVKGMTEKYRQAGENGFGWGVNVFKDQAGDGRMGTLQLNGNLAYQVFMGKKSMLAAGLQLGFMQRSIQFDKLQWGTQYDANAPDGYNATLPQDKAVIGGDNNFIVPDLGLGAAYTYKKNERYSTSSDQMDITAGIAILHLNRPKYSFFKMDEKLSPRITFHGNAIIGIPNSKMAVAPGYMIAKQGPNTEVFAGSLFRYMLQDNSKITGFIKSSAISAGGFFRAKDAFVAMALFEFSSYGIGISYDFNYSGLKTVSTGRGGFEISLRYLNPSSFLYSQASFNK